MDPEFWFVVLFWIVVAFGAFWAVGIAVEGAAQRGERIYVARHRDHASVPPMRWKEPL